MHMHSTKKYPVQIVCDGDAESPQKICWAGHVPPRKCYEQEIRCGPEPDVMPALENTGGTWRSALNVLQSPFFWPKCEHFIGEYDVYIYMWIFMSKIQDRWSSRHWHPSSKNMRTDKNQWLRWLARPRSSVPRPLFAGGSDHQHQDPVCPYR